MGVINGSVVLKPEAVSYSTTSGTTNASIGANGTVTFTETTFLSIPYIFTSTYNDYVVLLDARSAVSTSDSVYLRLMSDQTPIQTSNYTQIGFDTLTGAWAARALATQTYFPTFTYPATNYTIAAQIYIGNPYVTGPTTMKCTSTESQYYPNATFCTHLIWNRYNGLYLFTNSTAMTGSITIYGVRK